MLTSEIIEIIERNTIGSVATVSPDGDPCVSPKGMFKVIDERTIVFAHARSLGTLYNLRHNPSLEVCFSDIFHRKACRIRGTARVLEATHEDVGRFSGIFAVTWPTLAHLIKAFVEIEVTQAKLLTSPVYDIGMEADDLARHWLAHYARIYGASD